MALSSEQIITYLRNEYLRITGINIDFCASTDLRNKNRQGKKKKVTGRVLLLFSTPNEKEETVSLLQLLCMFI